MMGRLRPGVSFHQARSNLEGAFQRAALEGHQQYIARNPKRALAADAPRLTAASGSQGLNDSRSTYSQSLLMLMLMIVVALVLLIACTNAANLFLARGAARRKDIRMAIGADARLVLFHVMRETMLLVLIGIALGVGAALGTRRLVGSVLFGLAPNDPLTIILSALTLVSVAVVSGYLPARRASRIDPVRALRYE